MGSTAGAGRAGSERRHRELKGTVASAALIARAALQDLGAVHLPERVSDQLEPGSVGVAEVDRRPALHLVVDAGLVEAARSFGVGRGELIRRVVLPGALPGFLVGLRLALTGAWLSLIFAETINAKKGLGRMMTDAREYFQIDVVFVLIAVYAILGLLSIAVVRWLENRLLTWRRAYDGN